MFRSRGIEKNRLGKQLMFGDLYNHSIAAVVYVILTLGIGSVCLGFATSTPILLISGGMLLAISGVLLAINLSAKSLQLMGASSNKS